MKSDQIDRKQSVYRGKKIGNGKNIRVYFQININNNFPVLFYIKERKEKQSLVWEKKAKHPNLQLLSLFYALESSSREVMQYIRYSIVENFFHWISIFWGKIVTYWKFKLKVFFFVIVYYTDYKRYNIVRFQVNKELYFRKMKTNVLYFSIQRTFCFPSKCSNQHQNYIENWKELKSIFLYCSFLHQLLISRNTIL